MITGVPSGVGVAAEIALQLDLVAAEIGLHFVPIAKIGLQLDLASRGFRCLVSSTCTFLNAGIMPL